MKASEPSKTRIPSIGARDLADLFSEAIDEWFLDRAQRMGAALAFYSLLSLAPLLVVSMAVAAAAFGKDAVQGQLAWQIQNLVGVEGAKVVQQLILAAEKPVQGAFAGVLSLVALFLGSSGFVVELHDGLNTIWNVPGGTSGPILTRISGFFKERFFSFALVVGGGLLLLASIAWSAWIALVGKSVTSRLPLPELVLHLSAALVSFTGTALIFAVIYKIFPNVHLEWRDAIVGAVATSLLFTLGKQLLALYLGKESFDSTYGAAGSLVLLLVWIYYSAQVFYLGAEFTKVYTRKFGSHFTNRLQPNIPQPQANVVIQDTS